MFIFIVEENSIIWFYHQLFIHLIFDGYLIFFLQFGESQDIHLSHSSEQILIGKEP